MRTSLKVTSKDSPFAVLVLAFALTLAAVSPVAHGTAHAQQPTQSRYSVDSTIATLAGDKRARAIVDKYAPGLTSGPHYIMTAAFTPRQIKSRMSGMISDAKFNQMQTELRKLR